MDQVAYRIIDRIIFGAGSPKGELTVWEVINQQLTRQVIHDVMTEVEDEIQLQVGNLIVQPLWVQMEAYHRGRQ